MTRSFPLRDACVPATVNFSESEKMAPEVGLSLMR